jgi:hypothetical protein
MSRSADSQPGSCPFTVFDNNSSEGKECLQGQCGRCIHAIMQDKKTRKSLQCVDKALTLPANLQGKPAKEVEYQES